MEFFVAGSNKLKIVLTRDDCATFGIDTTISDFSTNEIRLAIRSVLELAGQECGFFTEGEKILAQLYPIPEGGCEIFVTKLKEVEKKTREAVRDVEGFTTIDEHRGVYYFRDSRLLISAARAIYREGIDCDLYISEDGGYYISIIENFVNGISEFEVLTEYGERLKYLPVYVISERGKLLCKGKALDYIIGSPQK